MTALAALLGTTFALGVLAMLRGLVPHVPPTRVARPSLPRRLDLSTREAVIGLTAALVVGGLTGWPVGGLLAAGAAVLAPRIWASRREESRATNRIEAVAGWTELLRDTMAGSAGLESAIKATAPVAPAGIAREVETLARRLDHHTRLVPALRAFAAEVADPTNDLVVASLILAAQHQTRELGTLLGELAQVAREDAATRLRVEATRARTRTSVRVVIGTTSVIVLGLFVFNRAYLAPFGTTSGQATLLVVGAMFGGAFAWLARMGRYQQSPRILAGVARAEP